MRHATLICILCLSTAATLAAGPPAPTLHVEARLADPGKNWTLGDPVAVEVTLRYPDGAPSPALRRQFPDAVALVDETTQKTARRGGEVTETRRLRLAFFATGAVATGPLLYSTLWQGRELRGEAPPLRVTIGTLRRDKKDVQPDAAEPPRVLPFPTSKLVLAIALVLAAAAAAGALLWWWLRRRARGRDVPAIPPHLEARDRLEALAGRDLPRQGRIREFYFAASEIVKDYLGKELGILILERTTREILVQLQDEPGLSAAARDRVTEFLTAADRVKFARHIPTTAQVEAGLRQAFDIVDQVHGEIEAHRALPAAAPPSDEPAPAEEAAP
jgi:hypothetical protein